jgi:ADP-ribosylglycohydrolase
MASNTHKDCKIMKDPWLQPVFLLQQEVNQRREEGFDVSSVADQIQALSENAPADEVNAWYARLDALPRRSDFAYDEPSDLAGIRAARPDGPRTLPRPDEAVRGQKILGAWLGRAAGCQLGKPVEGLPRHEIERYLKIANAYPLSDFVPLLDPVPEGLWLHRSAKVATRGNFSEMARDDDMDYTLLGMHIVEKFGANFNTADVAETWLLHLPFHMVYTAERAAYRNLVDNLPLEQVPLHRNPCREWIGAQIRADGWAYASPCLPERAAEYAWRDASLSHIKNGIYGEMWAAAMIAAAFAEPSGAATPAAIRRVIDTGLSEIPVNCRLAEAIHDVIGWHEQNADWESTWDKINAKYGSYHWVHTINNAAPVTLGLLYGNGDYARSISIAVMGGWDTDCNGATTGSVLGAMLGVDALPQHWIGQFNNRLRSAVIGYDGSQFTELAQRTLALSREAVAAK